MAVVAGSLVLVGSVGPPADAACQPQSRPMWSSSIWGRQEPNWNTCDGDARMYGRVLDAVSDGLCVSQVYLDGGRTYWAGTSCSTGGWRNYGYIDQTSSTVGWSKSSVHRSPWESFAWITQSGY